LAQVKLTKNFQYGSGLLAVDIAEKSSSFKKKIGIFIYNFQTLATLAFSGENK